MVKVKRIKDTEIGKIGDIIDVSKDIAQKMVSDGLIEYIEKEGTEWPEVENPKEFFSSCELKEWFFDHVDKILDVDYDYETVLQMLEESKDKYPSVTDDKIAHWILCFGETRTKVSVEIFVDELSKTEQADIFRSIKRKTAKTIKQNKKYQKIVMETPYILSMDSVTKYSRTLTRDYQFPVMVLPVTELSENSLHLNKYCKFKVRAISQYSAKKERWEFARLYESDGGGSTLIFPDEEKPAKWRYIPRHSFTYDRWIFLCEHEDTSVLVVSPEKMNVGREYYITGLTFVVNKFETRDGPKLFSKQLVCFVQHIKPVIDSNVLDAGIVKKMRGKPFSWFARSVSYPARLVPTYARLITTNAFSVRTGFPYNIMIMGDAGTSKTLMLEKFAVMFRAKRPTGNSKIKSFIPSFSPNNTKPGSFFTEDSKALVDEFFLLLTQSSFGDENVLDQLSKLKDAIEGKETTYQSGLGEQTVKMVADLVSCSNFPSKKGKGQYMGQYTSIIEMYKDFDPAFMDRILFYHVPKEQKEIRDRDGYVVDKMVNDVDEDLSKLDYNGYLWPHEVYQIHLFTRRLKRQVEDNEYYRERFEYLKQKVFPRDILSRGQKFFMNISVAFANIRQCIEGAYEDPNFKKIIIKNQDIADAEQLMVEVIDTYSGYEKLGSYSKEILALTEAQDELLGIIRKQWELNEKYAKILKIEELLQKTGYSEKETEELVENLVSKGLILKKKDDIMWLPSVKMGFYMKRLWEKLNSGEISKETELTNEEKGWMKALSKWGLASWNEQKGWFSLWYNAEPSEGEKIRNKIMLLGGEMPEDEFISQYSLKVLRDMMEKDIIETKTNGMVRLVAMPQPKTIPKEEEIIQEPATLNDFADYIKQNETAAGIDVQDLVTEFEKRGISQEIVDKWIDILKNESTIFENKPGRVKLL